MSACYWIIEGIGINAEDIREFIDVGKFKKHLRENHKGERFAGLETSDEFDIDDYLDGNLYDDLADLLTFFDSSDSLTYSEDEKGDSYLFYPPSMPWDRTENEPHTREEVHRRIVKAVQGVTSLTEESIENMIDDNMFVVCYG